MKVLHLIEESKIFLIRLMNIFGSNIFLKSISDPVNNIPLNLFIYSYMYRASFFTTNPLSMVLKLSSFTFAINKYIVANIFNFLMNHILNYIFGGHIFLRRRFFVSFFSYISY